MISQNILILLSASVFVVPFKDDMSCKCNHYVKTSASSVETVLQCVQCGAPSVAGLLLHDSGTWVDSGYGHVWSKLCSQLQPVSPLSHDDTLETQTFLYYGAFSVITYKPVCLFFGSEIYKGTANVQLLTKLIQKCDLLHLLVVSLSSQCLP